MSIAYEVSYFTKSSGAQIAYGVAGNGPPLVLPPAWASPLTFPLSVPLLVSLLSDFTVLTYDLEGSGLSSGRSRFEAGVTRHADELREVLDHVGLERAMLLGNSLAAPIAIDLAARSPDRVAALVMLGGYATGPGLFNERMVEAFPALVRANWGVASKALADMFVPNSTVEQREALALSQRRSFDPDTAAGLLGEIYEIDLADQLSAVRAPTLVLHSIEDRAIPFRGGQQIASGIKGARLMPIEGGDHPISFERGPEIARLISDFLRRYASAAPAGAQTESEQAPREQLTKRELEVLRTVATGASNPEIADRLSISVRTVERHVSNICQKLQVNNRTEAAGFAIRQGLSE